MQFRIAVDNPEDLAVERRPCIHRARVGDVDTEDQRGRQFGHESGVPGQVDRADRSHVGEVDLVVLATELGTCLDEVVDSLDVGSFLGERADVQQLGATALVEGF